jgi:hypothetical protein
MLLYLFNTFFSINLIAIYLFGAPFTPKFEAQTIDSSIAIGYGLALGDVDGDGKPDILLADKKQFVWYRNGDWKRFVMLDSLTEHDNVCIAARDINGDGKVEVAVGAQWNPGETTDIQKSGSVHYLVQPPDPTKPWKAVKLYHEPTTHRMQWVKLFGGKYALIVVPLHGRGNNNGEGVGARVLTYHFPDNVYGPWQIDTLEKTMHLTHNFDVKEDENTSKIYLAGKEGVSIIEYMGSPVGGRSSKMSFTDRGVGEVRTGKLNATRNFIATIEPMHGDEVVVYPMNESERIVLDNNIKEGHALAIADLLGSGSDQIVAGWRVANNEGKVGVKLYSKINEQGTKWQSYWIDENGMACEDLKIMDMNGDGRLDVVASGRGTHNLKIYWNK